MLVVLERIYFAIKILVGKCFGKENKKKRRKPWEPGQGPVSQSPP
jgi:hypothetical protein